MMLATGPGSLPDGCFCLGFGACCEGGDSFIGCGAAGAASCFGAFLGAGFFLGGAPAASLALKSLKAATASCKHIGSLECLNSLHKQKAKVL